YRPAKPGQLYWRIAQFLFPFYTQPPEGVLGHKAFTRAWVPMDDEHTMYFNIGIPRPRYPIEGTSPKYPGVRSGMLPNDTGWYGRFRLEARAENDYLIDRHKQRTEDYSGIESINTQDQAITESMGAIYDRTEEHLAVSDVMVIRVRRRLLAAVRAFQQKGTVPPGVDQPEVYRVRSGGVLLPEGADWIAATEELRRAYAVHPPLA
ncbi:MAG: (2Fe-2S)-binding protein, partial [Firmicutes bacterium]|nr:(2Fe-2S)-binding protein [Alicyclobacillaceae bacterium]MCL6498051.1 (2Fe-2S)-binding protein [Bacillota bacterium]